MAPTESPRLPRPVAAELARLKQLAYGPFMPGSLASEADPREAIMSKIALLIAAGLIAAGAFAEEAVTPAKIEDKSMQSEASKPPALQPPPKGVEEESVKFESSSSSSASSASKAASATTDPYLWLEEVEGEKQLAWARERNAAAKQKFADSDAFRKLEGEMLAILDSDAKIPMVQKIGAHYYNFWQDKTHARGIWRRTTPSEYAKASPAWETLIDLDALNEAEGENWVWHAVDCLKPDSADAPYDRCLIALSRGGADADVTREFSLANKSWVKDGFFREEAKGAMGWIDRDGVYVFTDFGAGTMTESGYPRLVKEWRRGTPMSEAKIVYEGTADDMYIAAVHDDTRGFERDFVARTIAFYNDELYLRGRDGKLAKVDAPNSANKTVHRDWLTLQLREPYTAGGKTYASGSLLIADFDGFMQGARNFTVLFEPSDTTSLQEFVWTRSHLALNVLDNVRNRLEVASHGSDGWKVAPLAKAPDADSLTVVEYDDEDENVEAVFVLATDFLTPSTLELVEIGEAPKTLKTMPAFFDSSSQVAEQHFAKSKDGTRVPYFVVRPKDIEYDGSNPTLLYGYGGFEVALAPNYSGSVGKGWLEKGGVYVLANIRGGGEYGPRWHQAALKANRGRAYEDFAAVARDLAARRITSPGHLGAMGGSNGGLLTGNMLTQYPGLFGAMVIQVPLLDMQRYHKLLAGASWMAEYGDPDKPEEWAFIKTFSPYHLLREDADYPPTLITTSTRDDRVHPGHARKFTARMLEMDKDVTYYENIEGGHGGAADNKQQAFMSALAFTFLWEELSD